MVWTVWVSQTQLSHQHLWLCHKQAQQLKRKCGDLFILLQKLRDTTLPWSDMPRHILQMRGLGVLSGENGTTNRPGVGDLQIGLNRNRSI